MKTKINLLLFTLIVFTAKINSQTVHHGDLAANGSLYFRAEPVNNFLPDKEGKVYYYVHLQGVEKTLTGEKEHVPLNISVVLDHSGSMEGDKLAYSKEALKYIINNMDSKDILSIVLYDSNVDVLLQPQHLEDRNELLKKVDKIIAHK